MSFFPVETLHVTDPGLPDAVGEMRAGRLGGLLLRGVYSPARAAAMTARLAAGHDFAVHPLGVQFEAYSLGLGLDHAQPDLEGYLDGVEPWERACDGLGAAIDRRLHEVLTARAAAPIARPRGPDGRPYLGTTLRRLPPGGLIPPHCENEQMGRGPFEHLNGLIDGETLISFFLTLAPPESAGALAVHDLSFAELNEAVMFKGRTRVAHLLADRAAVRVTPAAGELLIFDGGRRIHQVEAVGGGRDRWTAGGFLAYAPGGDRIYRWS